MEFKFTTFSEFFDTISQDLNNLADNGLVKDRIVKQAVRRATEDLGYRLFQSKQCKITVKNYKAPIPEDLWKIENIFALCTTVTQNVNNLLPIQGFREKFHFGPPEQLAETVQERIEYMGVIKPCESDCSEPSHVSSYMEPDYFPHKENLSVIPLHLSKTIKNQCTNYSPCDKWKGHFQADLRDGEFIFSFKEGTIFLSYLGDLVNEDGELLIPLQAQLYDYYKWLAINYVYEDLILNHDIEVITWKTPYELSERRRSGAKADAMNYLWSPREGQLEKIKKDRHMRFYNKWYKMFE